MVTGALYRVFSALREGSPRRQDKRIILLDSPHIIQSSFRTIPSCLYYPEDRTPCWLPNFTLTSQGSGAAPPKSPDGAATTGVSRWYFVMNWSFEKRKDGLTLNIYICMCVCIFYYIMHMTVSLGDSIRLHDSSWRSIQLHRRPIDIQWNLTLLRSFTNIRLCVENEIEWAE